MTRRRRGMATMPSTPRRRCGPGAACGTWLGPAVCRASTRPHSAPPSLGPGTRPSSRRFGCGDLGRHRSPAAVPTTSSGSPLRCTRCRCHSRVPPRTPLAPGGSPRRCCGTRNLQWPRSLRCWRSRSARPGAMHPRHLRNGRSVPHRSAPGSKIGLGLRHRDLRFAGDEVLLLPTRMVGSPSRRLPVAATSAPHRRLPRRTATHALRPGSCGAGTIGGAARGAGSEQQADGSAGGGGTSTIYIESGLGDDHIVCYASPRWMQYAGTVPANGPWAMWSVAWATTA